MLKNNTIHITYIWRLEKEKGIEIIIACIKRSLLEKKNIIWHICGNGSYMEDLVRIADPSLILHWHLNKDQIDGILQQTDLVVMPSLFLETFGLVALETLTHGVPVCGFARGWLNEFIHPSLALDDKDPVGSLFHILDTGEYPLMDISRFSYDIWVSKLRELTSWFERILLINDYIAIVGWAEQYVQNLAQSLRSIGKEVEIIGYQWNTSSYMRKYLMVLAPFAFWRGTMISQHIQRFSPDLIWMHSILRYIWPHGVAAVSRSSCTTYMTHHDLGLITPRPSQIYHEWDIPKSSHLGDWIPKKINIFSIIATCVKWSYVQWIWNLLHKNNMTHIIPSNWMSAFFRVYTLTIPTVFPHTTTTNTSVK